MDQQFWFECWQKNQIGFHLEGRANPCLDKYWPNVQVDKQAAVFVPLCGKSLDLLWFRDQDYSVVGVELVEKAVIDFFAENNITPEIEEQDDFKVYFAENITIYCGDFFKLNQAHLSACQAIYDRASMVAWKEPSRASYTAHLMNILPKQVKGLLVVMQYPQHEMPGPPFSVGDDEITQRVSPYFAVTELGVRDILKYEPQFQQRGLTQLEEKVYLLQPLRD